MWLIKFTKLISLLFIAQTRTPCRSRWVYNLTHKKINFLKHIKPILNTITRWQDLPAQFCSTSYRALLVSARAPAAEATNDFRQGLTFHFWFPCYSLSFFGFGSWQVPKCYCGPRAHRAPSFVVISKLLLPTSTRKIESFSFRTHNSLFSLLNSFGIVGIQGSVIFGCGCEIKTKIAAPTGFFPSFFSFRFSFNIFCVISFLYVCTLWTSYT